MPTFEFDPAKSEASLAKHGIDFETAQTLWKDEKLLEIDARSTEESRFMAIAVIDQVLWAAVCTLRPGGVRIISVRRARKQEVQLYEGQ